MRPILCKFKTKYLVILSLFLWSVVGMAQTASTDTLCTQVSNSSIVKPEFYYRQIADSNSARYLKASSRYVRVWNRLMPRHVKLQYAGGTGLLAIGPGWHYGRYHDTFETDVLLGFVPRFSSDHAKMVFTLKQVFKPWHVRLNPLFTLSPLNTGLFFTTISGNSFWKRQPQKYPKGYYWFSTKIRSHVFVGQSLKLNIPPQKRMYHKSIELYYELNTCDLYILSAVTNRYLKLRDILGLAIGLKLEML